MTEQKSPAKAALAAKLIRKGYVEEARELLAIQDQEQLGPQARIDYENGFQKAKEMILKKVTDGVHGVDFTSLSRVIEAIKEVSLAK